jgi:hypothetical protein
MIIEDQPEPWMVEFAGWAHLSREHRRLLLAVVGDCAGEWWGDGRAEFWSRGAALSAMTMAVKIGVLPSVLEPARNRAVAPPLLKVGADRR